MRAESSRARALTYVVLVGFSLLTLLPLVGALLLSLQPSSDSSAGLGLSHLTVDNFTRAWTTGQFGVGIRNSLLVAAGVVLIAGALSTLTGYAFGTMTFAGDRLLFYVFLLGLIVPFESAIVPLYYGLRSVGLTDTYWGLILPQAGAAMAFGTFWMRAVFKAFPKPLLEAAQLDGATSFRTLTRVVLPNVRPAIFTLIILQFMWTWNEFLLALVMISRDSMKTVPLGLAAFVGNHSTDTTGLAAASIIVALPIVLLFIAFRRPLISGMLSGAIR